MDYRGIDILCPSCRADLSGDKGTDSFICSACGQEYPVIRGIPDLRLFPGPYAGFEKDRASAIFLDEQCAGLDFAGSVEVYYRYAEKDLPFQAYMFTRSLMSAVPRVEYALDTWETHTDKGRMPKDLLEIGCGTAALLAVASQRYERVVGIDIALRWLVIARKRLEEMGVDAPVLCACAEALPFPDRYFDRVVADSVIEHVRDQPGTLAECDRVMRPGSYLFLSTPNRFSVGRDPHVGIWAGGYLPKRWIDAYMDRRGGAPPARRLLSYRSLRQLIEEAGFACEYVGLPHIVEGQRAYFGRAINCLIDLYHLTMRLPQTRRVLYWIAPLFLAVARKPALHRHGATAGAT